jgi:hypothetical protein
MGVDGIVIDYEMNNGDYQITWNGRPVGEKLSFYDDMVAVKGWLDQALPEIIDAVRFHMEQEESVGISMSQQKQS